MIKFQLLDLDITIVKTLSEYRFWGYFKSYRIAGLHCHHAFGFWLFAIYWNFDND